MVGLFLENSDETDPDRLKRACSSATRAYEKICASLVDEWIAGPQPAPAFTLNRLLLLSRSLAIEDITPAMLRQIPQRFTWEESPDGKNFVGSRISAEGEWLYNTMDSVGFQYAWNTYGRGKNSDNPKVRRLARLYEYAVPQGGHFDLYEGNIFTPGDGLIPSRWLVGFQLGGSGKFFQGNMVLSPVPLLSREQVERVMEQVGGLALPGDSPDADAEKLRQFGTKVHSLVADERDSPARDKSRRFAFKTGENWVKMGIKAFVIGEEPDQFGLYLFIGDEDFLDEAGQR